MVMISWERPKGDGWLCICSPYPLAEGKDLCKNFVRASVSYFVRLAYELRIGRTSFSTESSINNLHQREKLACEPRKMDRKLDVVKGSAVMETGSGNGIAVVPALLSPSISGVVDVLPSDCV